MLTQDGWQEPEIKRRCSDCGEEYTKVGVEDVRWDEGICFECQDRLEIEHEKYCEMQRRMK